MAVVLIDDQDPTLVYGSGWTHYQAPSQHYNNTSSLSRSSGSTVALQFNGISIALYGSPGPNTTIAFTTVVDGGSSAQTNIPTPTTQLYRQLFFQSPPLSAGNHSFLLTNAIDGDWLWLDYFNITTDITTDLPGSTSSTVSAQVTSSTVSAQVTSSTVSAQVTSSTVSAQVTTTTLPQSTNQPQNNTSTQSSSNNTQSSSNFPPIAAIVGGTLGGIAVICVLVFGFLYLRRRRRRRHSPPFNIDHDVPSTLVEPFIRPSNLSVPDMWESRSRPVLPTPPSSATPSSSNKNVPIPTQSRLVLVDPPPIYEEIHLP